MRRLAVVSLFVAAALAACSRQNAGDGYGEPDVAPSAAPGVAFRFTYDYSLDDDRISAVQEAHAAACERLGLAKCRITGLRYQIDPDKRVFGSLQVKLDPVIARQFGKQATAFVASNDGELVRSEFAGEDVGTRIGAGQDKRADIQARIAEIEKRLASVKSGDREATELQSQLAELRGQLVETRNDIKEGQLQLASTPMTFNYYGEGGIAGFDENPFKASWRLMAESAVTMINIVLKVVGAALPWALLLLLLIAIFRSRPARAARDFWRRIAPMPGNEES